MKIDNMLAELEELEPVSIDRLVELGAEKGSLSDLMVKYDEPTIYDRFARLINEFGDGLDVTVIFEKDGKQIASRRI